MFIKAFHGAWETAQGRVVFELADDGKTGRLSLPGRAAFSLAVEEWRDFSKLIAQTIKATPRSGPARAGAPWDAAEDARLENAFHNRVDIARMAENHGRSRGAIFARLEALGLIDPYKVRFGLNEPSRAN